MSDSIVTKSFINLKLYVLEPTISATSILWTNLKLYVLEPTISAASILWTNFKYGIVQIAKVGGYTMIVMTSALIVYYMFIRFMKSIYLMNHLEIGNIPIKRVLEIVFKNEIPTYNERCNILFDI